MLAVSKTPDVFRGRNFRRGQLFGELTCEGGTSEARAARFSPGVASRSGPPGLWPRLSQIMTTSACRRRAEAVALLPTSDLHTEYTS
jgi:hypothetical protein